ncbi:MAG: hypothetical protein RJA10_2496 [Pseudomonadota bacterium]|jgi:thiol-disulfide isomerase/thioredoxin
MNPLRRLLLLAALLGPAAPALAVDALRFKGTTLDGQRFDIQQQRGRVLMVMLWRTDCSVCLSKMPEMRDNAAGWKGKPFDLVLLNLDRDRTDVALHHRAQLQLDRSKALSWTLWKGDAEVPPAWAEATRLPVLMIFDAKGVMTKRHEGRLPAEVWDDIAEMLP